MVDNLEPNAIDESAVPEPSKRASFLASTQAKVVIAVVAVFVLLIIAGVVGFILIVSGGDPKVTTPPPAASNPGGQPAAEATVTAPAEPALEDSFTFRNVFKPSVKAPPVPKPADSGTGTDGSGTTTDTTGGTTAGDGELKLLSIQTDGGTRTATLSWDGQSYELEEGESIPDSPWKVVNIGTDSVTVIYGDSSPIELTVGDTISK